ncbi:MAG: TolC family protein [Acidobacteriota bacterium]|nr:TolC family protein [Acidobacteriota bacterium]
MIRRTPGLLWAVAALLAITSLHAQSGETEEGVTLTLSQCLKTALENNLDLVSSRKDPEIAEQSVVGQQSFFDPNLSISASLQETEQQPTDPTQPSSRETTSMNASLAQELPFGADYSATFFTNQDDAPGFNFFNPFYTSGLDLRFNVPLLRGLGKTATTERLVLSRKDQQMSEQELLRQAMQTIETVEGAYWDVAAARRAKTVAQQSLRRANDLLELNRKKVEVGTLAPIEITQAEAGVASEVEQSIIAETNLGNAEDELRRLMAVPTDDAMWDKPLLASDRPNTTKVDVDVEAVLATALSRRPEMINARVSLDKDLLSEKSARNATKSDLTFNARVTPTGDSLEIPGGMAPPVNGDLGDSIGEIPDFNNYTWSAGFTYNIPIRNRSARSAYRTSTLNREKSELAVSNQEQTIRVEVRRAVREVTSGIRRFEASTANVELQRKKLEAEEKKFENGMSTSFEVLTFQNDLADAELSQIRAAVDYQKALAALERVQGTMLEARGLSLN